MNPEIKPEVELGPAAAAPAVAPTVQDLISDLRSTFFNTDFQNVAKLLSEREEKMKKHSAELEKKVELIGNERDHLFLETLKLKDELKKKQQEFDAIRKVNVEYEGKLSVMKSEKRRVEAELTAYKNKFAELEERVSSIMGKTSEISMAPGGAVMIMREKNEGAAAECIRTCEEEGLNKVTKLKNPEIIQINNDDDDQVPISTLKRKWVSSEIKKECHNDDGINQIGMKKTKNLQEFHDKFKASKFENEVKNVQSSLDSSQSSSGSDDEDNDGPYKDIIAKMRMRKEGWQFEADMAAAFHKDDLLCLNAICALHRQRIRGKFSSFGSQLIPTYDATRITKLAELLIDGDPQLKLKKSVSEVKQSDLDDCRKFAKRGSRIGTRGKI